jgi:hypothetical protein
MTVAQLLALHPFPAEYANEKRTERLWTFARVLPALEEMQYESRALREPVAVRRWTIYRS